MTQPTFRIITLGCKVNQYESAYMAEALTQAGWQQAGEEESSHVTIVNTCVVTQKAGHQSRQAIRKAIRENPAGRVAAIGCYAQAFSRELSAIKGVELVAGNMAKATVPDLVMEALSSRSPRVMVPEFRPGMSFEFMPIKTFPDRKRVYLKIQDGCESFCSYCIVPFARGGYRSLPQEKALEVIEGLCGQGYKEIVLTGIHLGKYGVDLGEGESLTGLLCAIEREAWPVRIRLSSLEPTEIDDELIDRVASEAWLCRHFHVPLQSGDDGILKRMNRPYTSRAFARLMEKIHGKIPWAAIGIDVMSGFPGEDNQAHQNTYDLIGALPVSYLHVFPFSARPGTEASNYGGRVAPPVIKKRAEALRLLGQKKRASFYERCLGERVMVLVEEEVNAREGLLRGTSDNYLSVTLQAPPDQIGQVIAVRVNEVTGEGVVGSPEIP